MVHVDRDDSSGAVTACVRSSRVGYLAHPFEQRCRLVGAKAGVEHWKEHLFLLSKMQLQDGREADELVGQHR